MVRLASRNQQGQEGGIHTVGSRGHRWQKGQRGQEQGVGTNCPSQMVTRGSRRNTSLSRTYWATPHCKGIFNLNGHVPGGDFFTTKEEGENGCWGLVRISGTRNLLEPTSVRNRSASRNGSPASRGPKAISLLFSQRTRSVCLLMECGRFEGDLTLRAGFHPQTCSLMGRKGLLRLNHRLCSQARRKDGEYGQPVCPSSTGKRDAPPRLPHALLASRPL